MATEFQRIATRPGSTFVDRHNDSRALDRRVQLVLKLIEENSERRLVLHDIARIVNLSPGRLAHLFKDEMGIALQQYLTQLRLAKAVYQLEFSFRSIKEIASMVGFCSLTQFSISFKNSFGITPSEFRKRPQAITSNTPQILL